MRSMAKPACWGASAAAGAAAAVAGLAAEADVHVVVVAAPVLEGRVGALRGAGVLEQGGEKAVGLAALRRV